MLEEYDQGDQVLIPNSWRAKIAGRNCKKIKTELLDDQDRRAKEQDKIVNW